MNNPFPDMNTSNMSKHCFRPIQERATHTHTIQSSSQDTSATFDEDIEELVQLHGMPNDELNIGASTSTPKTNSSIISSKDMLHIPALSFDGYSYSHDTSNRSVPRITLKPRFHTRPNHISINQGT